MADDRGADRSSIEVKTLVRKLHPQRGNHNDRIRQLNKFRNYVIADRVSASVVLLLIIIAAVLLYLTHSFVRSFVLSHSSVDLLNSTMTIYRFSG